MYSKILRGTFTSTGVAKPLYLPMIPDTIEIWNKTKWATTTNHVGVSAMGFSEDNAGTAYITESNGTAWLGKIITSGGFTFFSAGDYQYGAVFTITAIDHTTGVVTTSAPHGYSVGDAVLIYNNVVMKQIGGYLFTVTAVGSTTTFTIDIGGLVGANDETGASVKRLLYPDLYIPQGCNIVSISKASQAVVTFSTAHNFVLGQEVFFVVPPQFGMTEMDSQVYQQQHQGIPQKAYVVALSTYAITVNINSSAFTTFALPSSATAALGVTPAQCLAIGDQNTGWQTGSSGQVPYLGVTNGAIGIPGAFTGNTRQGVIVGTGDGTEIIHANNDVIAWRAIFPDAVMLNQ